MPLSTHDALIHLMVLAAFSDAALSEAELAEIETIIVRWPVFEGFDRARLEGVVNECADRMNRGGDLDAVLDEVLAALPQGLYDTAYAAAVDVTAVDLSLEQEELRFLEMLRDRLPLDRLMTAAIETATRARHRRMNGLAAQ